MPRDVLEEIRWSFTLPMIWLQGVGANLVLSFLWLLWAPLTGRPREDWVVVVGSYFATFVLADVTTTNVLGPDAQRVVSSLDQGQSTLRILLRKNAALLVIVGLPTLVATAILTVTSEDSYRLAVTLPGVAFPIFTWLGVGNIVSVLLPVRSRPLRERWARREDRRSTFWWLFHLGLPYLLWYGVNPLGAAPRAILRSLARASRTDEVRGLVLTTTGVAIWLFGTAVAAWLVRVRGLRLR
ncbi:MAG: hypothetical protein JWO63_3362 [Frankiales bacterium]|nr:hypothetical protein [Frankiales bacterium]